jgi:hypothetical protein
MKARTLSIGVIVLLVIGVIVAASYAPIIYRNYKLRKLTSGILAIPQDAPAQNPQ